MVRIALICAGLAACAGDEQPNLPADAASHDAGADAVQRDAVAPDRAVVPVDPGGAIAVDGLFDDWAGMSPLATDPAGDASGAFDLTTVYAATRDTTVYLRFAHGAAKNLNAGPAEEGTLVIDLALTGGGSLTADLRARKLYRDGDPGQPLGWLAARYRALPTFAASEHELAVDLAAVGAAPGDEVSIRFSGSDELERPITLAMTTPMPSSAVTDAARAAGASVRLLSFNTRVGGLSDPARKAALSRILHVMDADVVCLQEEVFTSEADLAAALPAPAAGGWTFLRIMKGAVLASRWPMVRLALGARFVGGAITLPDGKQLVVYSFHPDCCGHIGSAEDSARNSQTRALVDSIAALRAGTLGEELTPFADAPVIVAGDWNLVASDTPLRMVEDAAGPALTHWLLRHQADDEIYTWRSDEGGFPPGMLDLVVYDAARLRAEKGFIFDSAALDAQRLAELGVEAGDSGASDHLALITDFAFR